jgi:hypothetical protein
MIATLRGPRGGRTVRETSHATLSPSWDFGIEVQETDGVLLVRVVGAPGSSIVYAELRVSDQIIEFRDAGGEIRYITRPGEG